MSRFPNLTETFVLYEMLAVEKQGIQVDIYPLLRSDGTSATKDGASIWKKFIDLHGKSNNDAVMHPEALPLAERAHYLPFLSWPIVAAQFYFLRRKPLVYLGALWALVRGTWGSVNFFVGGMAIFPKTVFFARLMEADRITHVHAHFANHPAAAAFIIHRLIGMPYSFTAHGSDLHRRKKMLREKVTEAAFVVPISGYNKEHIKKVCGDWCSDRLVLIHCGVDTRVFCPPSEDPRAGLTNQRFTILNIGKLHEVKGQPFLIEACRLLRERNIDFVCHIVGDGPDKLLLQEQITRAGLTDCIILLGSRTRSEIAELYRKSHVLAAPSVPTRTGRREGIPVVLMEAMASGLPVVASKISGIPELVEDNLTGILTPPGSAANLADALQRLHDDPALRGKMGLAGRAKVIADFNLDKNAALLAELFVVHEIKRPHFFKN